ncbi:MAG: hypothetical protein AB2660_05285 [Candidatus Thiodiazotropha sp.]
MFNSLPSSPQITVVDSIMGAGKSTWLINHLNQEYADISTRTPGNPPKKYVVIVHDLSEVDRFTAACPALDFKDPQPVYGRKLYGLQALAEAGENIVTTHALFQLMTPEVVESFHSYGYTLMVDEVMSAVEVSNILKSKDREMLVDAGYLSADDSTGHLRWNDDLHSIYPADGRFNDIKKLCNIGSLVLFNDTTLLWEFPSEFLKAFRQIYVFTYMFEGSPMAAYLKSQGYDYVTKSVSKDMRELIDLDEVDESDIKTRLRDLIMIYEGPMNHIGKTPGRGKARPMSAGWYKNADNVLLAQLKASTQNFFKKVADTPASENMWTAYKSVSKKLKGARYARQWTPVNLKATNDLIEKRSLAYLCNVHLHPSISNYFSERKIPISNDLYALSELVQWLWRSQIRRGDPIHVFIPSQRMRDLLTTWLNTDSILELKEVCQTA